MVPRGVTSQLRSAERHPSSETWTVYVPGGSVNDHAPVSAALVCVISPAVTVAPPRRRVVSSRPTPTSSKTTPVSVPDIPGSRSRVRRTALACAWAIAMREVGSRRSIASGSQRFVNAISVSAAGMRVAVSTVKFARFSPRSRRPHARIISSWRKPPIVTEVPDAELATKVSVPEAGVPPFEFE